MAAAVVEAVRWWIMFDGPKTVMIQRNNGRVTKSDVRDIASTYNFRRNLPADDQGVEKVVDCVNRFPKTRFTNFLSRANAIQEAVLCLQAELSTPQRKRNIRIVSGMTKLTWFVAPDHWTPFDRLAAKAVGANKADTLERMKQYYALLDGIEFTKYAAAITDCVKGTVFEGISGERVLDKFLMGYGEPDWTFTMVRNNEAFEESLPKSWREDLRAFKIAVLESDAMKFDRRAIQ